MNSDLPQQKPVRRFDRRWWLLTPLFLLAAALITAVLWPLGPELVPYVSPPLDASGARLHVLVPRGWKAVHPFTPAWPGSSSHILLFMPGDPMASVPAWLRRWMPVHAEPGAYLFVLLSPNEGASEDPDGSSWVTVVTLEAPPVKGRRGYEQHRTAARAGIEAQLTYFRTDRAAYERTQAAIARSVTIGR